MSRVIKFRVWDKTIKKMSYPKLWDSSMPSNWDHFYEVQQFTGLHDNNGTPIFEGDIMQHANPFDIPFVVNWIDTECAFGFNNGCTSYSITDKSFTVIGNLHEHPELLKTE